MNYMKITIDTDYDDYTDEMEELTKVLQKEIEENDKLNIEEVKIPTKPGIKDSKGLEVMEIGKLLIDVVLSPEVAATLILILHSWIRDKKKTDSIAKSISLDFNNKRYTLTGYSGDDVEKLIREIKKGE